MEMTIKEKNIIIQALSSTINKLDSLSRDTSIPMVIRNQIDNEVKSYYDVWKKVEESPVNKENENNNNNTV